jgi:3-oxoacyl-[acyl-carrier-protein] synthase II
MVRQNSIFLYSKMISDIACGHISIKYGFRGPNFATVSACALLQMQLLTHFNYIRLGHADVMVTGGSEAHAGAGVWAVVRQHAYLRNDFKASDQWTKTEMALF